MSDRLYARRERWVASAPVTESHHRAATHAIDVFRKGRGDKAQLDLGDCMSYATAKCSGAPLLYKSDDFTHTDIRPAYLT